MTARLDKWLWAVRLFKTRSLAAAAIRAGAVTINDRPAKPAREVHAGETVVVQQGLVTRTLRVIGAPASRARNSATRKCPPFTSRKSSITTPSSSSVRDKGGVEPGVRPPISA